MHTPIVFMKLPYRKVIRPSSTALETNFTRAVGDGLRYMKYLAPTFNSLTIFNELVEATSNHAAPPIFELKNELPQRL